VWAQRAVLAAVLLGAAVLPGHVTGTASAGCQNQRCGSAGKILWARQVPGSWTASQSGGTVLTQGQAFTAAGGTVAALGFGHTITAFDLKTGSQLWDTAIGNLPVAAAIDSVRAWPGVVTVGVVYPATRRGPAHRREFVLRARTGAQLGAHPASLYGGAVAASAAATEIVGPDAVTSYSNTTGRVRWQRPTGRVPQAWRIDGSDLYVTISAGGYLSTSPVTGVRRIGLRSGTEQVIRPDGRSFGGTLSGALDGVVLFSGPRGVSAYGGMTGEHLWSRAGVVVQSTDEVQDLLYLTKSSTLLAVSPATGVRIKGRTVFGSAGLYGVRGGVALGLDHGPSGDAWGYRITRQRVIWTTPQLPWPHFFTDLSGLGGSANPGSSIVLLASCAAVGASHGASAGTTGPAVPDGSAASAGSAGPGGPEQAGQNCLRPELVALHR
jgi:PQQ-like domain